MRLRGLVGLAVAALAGCTAPPTEVPVRIEVEHLLGRAPLQLDREGPEGRVVTRLSYYFGGVRLHDREHGWVAARPDGTDLTLVDARLPASLTFEAAQVPPRIYDSLEFRIGVPRALADGTARSGPLDPAHGMFWTWKAGYVFFALEGRAPESSANDRTIFWHAGGDASLVRTVVLPLEDFRVIPGSSPVIHLGTDLDALITSVDARQHPQIMDPAQSAPVMDAVAGTFRVEHVHVDAAPATARAGDSVPIGSSL